MKAHEMKQKLKKSHEMKEIHEMKQLVLLNNKTS